MLTTALRSLNLAAAACAAFAAGTVLWLTMQGEAVTVLGWSNGLAAPTVQPVVAQAQAVPLDTSGDLTQLQHAPTISAAQIDAVLAQYGSPAAGMGQVFYDTGVEYGINPALALAFYVHESSAGTAGAAIQTRSIGNIICAGWSGQCIGRFRAYNTYGDAIADWYKLIRTEYIDGRGCRTVADVIPVYAPATENDVQAYIDAVNGMVASWAQPKHAVTNSMHISTDFDATGDVWCSVGQLHCQHYGTDYDGQPGDPVYAPYAMTVYAVGCYPPGPTEGCYVQGTLNDGLVLYLGHLATLPPFSAGQRIDAGQQVGTMGRMAHTHVQLAPKGEYRPCATDGTCLNFDDYYASH